MALLYNRYRLKQRTNRKLELQQREIAKQNISLQHLVNEKDWLIKEIHHRVKNNLQIVMSLLNSQSAYINNEFALNAIQESQHRVHAMSLIHQKLYNTESLSSIDMSLYIRELVSYLGDSFETSQRIRFEFDLTSIEMDVSEAVPLGLILNEAITNSIKYAFPEGGPGIISISLSNIDSHQCLLIISDNGVGIPDHFNNKKPGSLGMSLMQGLSEDLEGNFSIENKNGTTIKVSFIHDLSIKQSEKTESFVLSN
jgi:two-component sensor histidine kinase